MLNLLAAAGMAASLLTAPLALPFPSDPTPPPAEQITINVVTVNGSGCEPGTAATALAPDSTAFTVTYSKYMAQVGVGAGPTDFRKNCQLNLKVMVPQGFTYAIAKADYRGFAYLEKGASATEQANYYFQGSSETARIKHTFKGEYDDNFTATDEVGVDALVYAPCGEKRNLNINTELRVNAGSSNTKKTTSFMSMDSTDGSIKTIYHFAWKTCPKK
jgi:hypothetical protein